MTKKVLFSAAKLQLRAILENKLAFDPDKLALHLNRSNLEEPIDDEGNTPLMYAVKHNQRQLVRFLLGMGANPEKVFALADGLEDKQIYWYLRNYQKTDQQLLKMIHIHRDAIHAYIPQVKTKGGRFIKILQAIVDEMKTQDLTTLNLYEKYDLYFTVSQLARMAVHSTDDPELAENLAQFFAKREALIQNTSMDYCFGDSIANRICGKVAQIDESKSNIYETLFKHRKTAERKEEWQQWRWDLESTDELPTNPELLFAWQPKTSGTQPKYGELHLWDAIAGTAIMALKKVENEYEHVWKKTDPKYRRTAKDSDYKPEPLPPIALAILRQKGPYCQELVDYYLQISSAMADEKSITGNFAKLRKELRTNNYQRDINQREFAQLNAGEDVYAAIPNFFIWFEGLPENVRTPLSKLNAKTDGGHFSILELINLLRDYMETDRSKHKFCIYSISGFLFAVLQTNPVRLAKIQLILNPHSKLQPRKSNQELAALYEAILLELKKPSSTPILINNGASRLGEFIQQYLDRQILMDNPGEALFTEFLQMETPLNLAIMQGDSKRIASLVEDGADIYRQNFRGEDAIAVAKKINRLNLIGENILIIDKIIKKQDKNLLVIIAEQCPSATKNQINLYLGLNEVIEKNDFVRIEEILESTPELFTHPPQFAEFKGETLLTYTLTKWTRSHSVRNTHIEYLIEFLLEQDVDPFEKNSHHHDLFDLAHKLNIHMRLTFLETALNHLYLAFKQGQEQRIQQIIKYYSWLIYEPLNKPIIRTVWRESKITGYERVGLFTDTDFKYDPDRPITLALRQNLTATVEYLISINNDRFPLLLRQDLKEPLFPITGELKLNNFFEELMRSIQTSNLKQLMLLFKLSNNLYYILNISIVEELGGETLLTYAIKHGANPEILKFLLDNSNLNNCNLLDKNLQGESIFSLKNKYNVDDIFKQNGVPEKLAQQAYNAARNGNLTQLQQILDYCPEVIYTTFDNGCSSIILVYNNHDKVKNLLFSRGIVLTDEILDLMVQRKILLDPSNGDYLIFPKKPYSELSDSKKNNLYDELKDVLINNDLNRLKKLLSILSTHTVSLNDGETLLTFSIKNGIDPEILKFLFTHSNPLHINRKQESPIYLLLKSKIPKLDFESDKFHENLREEFLKSINLEKLDVCTKILELYPYMINYEFTDGYTPLISAMQYSNDAIINLLINKGAQLSDKDARKKIFPFLYPNGSCEIVNLMKQFELACLYSNIPVLKKILICKPDFSEKYNQYYADENGIFESGIFIYNILKNCIKNGEDFFDRIMELKLKISAAHKESLWKMINDTSRNLYSLGFDFEIKWNGIEDIKGLTAVQNLFTLFPGREQSQQLATLLIEHLEAEHLHRKVVLEENHINKMYYICSISIIKKLELELAGRGAPFSTEFMENYLKSHIRKVVNADCKEHINIIKQIYTLRPTLFAELRLIHEHACNLPNMLMIIQALQLTIPVKLVKKIHKDPRLKTYLLKAIKTADLVTIQNFLTFFPQLINTQLTDLTQKPPRNGKPIDFASNATIYDFLRKKAQEKPQSPEKIRAQQEQKICFFSSQTYEASAKRMIERNIIELQSDQSLPLIKDIIYEFKNSEHDYLQKISKIEKLIQSREIDDLATQSLIEKLVESIKLYKKYHTQASHAGKQLKLSCSYTQKGFSSE